MNETGRFSDGDKALIKEIARVVIEDVLEYKLPAMLDKYCSLQKKECSAKNFFDHENNKYILDQLVNNKKNQTESRISWIKWILGSGIGFFGIKEVIELFHKK